MKKKLLILSTLSTIAIATTAIAIFASSNFQSVRGDGDNHNHDITFTKADLTPGTYDTDMWGQPFTLAKENAIVIKDTQKFDFESAPYNAGDYSGTFYYGEQEDVDFTSEDYYFTFTGNYNGFRIKFGVIDRTTFDLDKSNVLVRNLGTMKDSSVKFEYYESANGYNYYQCDFNTYASYGVTFGIVNTRIVFSC